ncbi:MAG: endolytic transglycosylase MltG, partial [Alphaproteobacteria bacterium]
MLRFVRAVLVLAILVAALAALAVYGAGRMVKAPGPEAAAGAETIVLLERGIGVKTIAKRLEAAGVITNADFFAIYVRVTGDGARLKAGEYAIPSGASMADILGILKAGKSILHKLTVPEGLTSAQAMRLIAAHEVLVGELGETPAEGALLPETYLFQRGTTRTELVADMTAAHDA